MDPNENNVLTLIQQYAHHPSAFLSMNKGTDIFTEPGLIGCVAYRPAGKKYYVCVGGVFAKPEHRIPLLEAFFKKAAADGRKVIAVQFLKEDAELLQQFDFRINQMGASYGLRIDDFSLGGTKFMKLRNKISRAKRLGIEVVELGKDEPYQRAMIDTLKGIDAQWLRSKGAKELDFLIGEVGDLQLEDLDTKRIFLARLAGVYIGYILYTPSYGTYQGWMHDLSRKTLDAPPGVMELINITALERFAAEGHKYLNFGFTPLTGLDNKFELPNNCSKVAAWIIKKLSVYGNVIYPAQSQLFYKKKWSPNIVLPEYIAFQGGFSLPALWSFLKVTRAI